MGMKAKKSMMKKVKKGSTEMTASARKVEAGDFLVSLYYRFSCYNHV